MDLDQNLLNDIARIDEQLEIGLSTFGSDGGYINLENTHERPTENTNNTSVSGDFSIPIKVNNSCQEVLKTIESKLLRILEENREKQEILLKYINKSDPKIETHENNIFKLVNCLGIPYFKDFHGYPQPRNDDVRKKVAKGELRCFDYLCGFHIWSKQDKERLKRAVLEEITSSKNTTEKNSAYTDINFEGNIIVEKDREKPMDWLKISATDLNGKYSATECESQWKLHLCPEVNKGKWSADEIKNLNALAVQYKFQDWDKIALELHTNRTGYQCCIHFQTKHSLNEGKWSQEEDTYLKELVQKYIRCGQVPWTKISWFFQTRSRKQCQDRYLEHLKSDLKRGFFSAAEDKIIMTGVKIFKDFGKIARFLPGRAATQIRSRYYYLISTSMTDFTKEEDELLMSLAKQHARNWLKISECFQSRSKLECRKRFNALCKETKVGVMGNLLAEVLGGANKKESNFQNCPTFGCNRKTRMNVTKKKGRQMKILETHGALTKENITYNEIVNYHEGCSEYYFGPRIRNPASEEELKELCVKLRSVMSILNVSCDFSNKDDLINKLKNNCNFCSYDVKILERLAQDDLDNMTFGTDDDDSYYLNGRLIPPNHCTLTGLNSLWASKQRIVNKTKEIEGLPVIIQDAGISDLSETKILTFSKSKSLFQSRLKSLFFLPLVMSRIATSELDLEVFYKHKTKKPKAMTRKRLRERAKKMCSAHKEKRRKLEESAAASTSTP